MSELEMFKKSVDMCNQRQILKEEYNYFFSCSQIKLQSLDEYKDAHWENNAPHKFFGFLSFVISLLFFAYSGITSLIGLPGDHPVVAISTLVVSVIIYFAVFYNLFMRCSKSKFDEYEKTLNEFNELMPEVVNARNNAFQRLSDFEKLMEDEANCIIPKKYWDHANELMYLIKNKRAVDLVSAINKFEDIQHQSRMEQMAAQSLAYNEMSAYAAEQARINSELAAEKASEALDYSKATFWQTYTNSNE